MNTQAKAGISRLCPHELAHLMDFGKVRLVDVREQNEFRAEHICGAVLDPLSGFDASRYATAGDVPVVFCCGTGKRSEQAANLVLARGVAHVQHLEGGLSSWRASGLSTQTSDSPP